MSARKALSGDLAAPVAIVAAMSVVATLGFRGVFPDWTFLYASVLGAVGAALVMIAGRWARLSVAETLAVSLVAFVLLGAVAAEGIPTPGAFATFFDGLIEGWANVLSSSPPADLTAELRVLPYTLAWMGAMVGGEILRSNRAPGLAALGPVFALAVSLLIVLEDRTVAIAQGGAMVVGALLLGWVQQRRQTNRSEFFEDFTISPPKRTAGLMGALGMVSIIAVGAPFIGPRLPFVDDNERFDLRQFQTPPFDPLEPPSPLVDVKVSLFEANEDATVFTVTSPERINRFKLAVMDDYHDGVVWTVADERGDAPGEFKPVDSVFPPPADADIADVDELQRVTATIEIVYLSDLPSTSDFDPPWLITAGWPLAIDADEPLDVRFNDTTGTVALVPEGPEEGLTYQITSALPPDISDVGLRDAPITKLEPTDLQPAVRAYAANTFEGVDEGWAEVAAIQDRLQGDLAFYDAKEGSDNGRPGHSLARIEEMFRGDDAVVGFEEQYAALAALMARSQGLPTRVVVGYLIPEDKADGRWVGDTLEVKAGDISAWIEVRFDGIGWVPFDVTPPKENEFDEQTAGTAKREVAVPNPPPPPPPPELPPRLEQEEELEEEEEEDDGEEDSGDEGIPVRTILTAGAASSPLVLMLAAAGTVLVMKRRRTRRRRFAGSPSRRVAGAWYEAVDRYQEDGASPKRAATPAEFARGLQAAEMVDPTEGAVLLQLAREVDQAAYHPRPAPPELAEDAWARTDTLLASLKGRQSLPKRMKRRLDPRPLFRKDPLISEDDDGDAADA